MINLKNLHCVLFSCLISTGLLVLAGCGDNNVDIYDDDLRGQYEPTLDEPEKLLNDLQTAYRRREIDPYVNLLAPEFLIPFHQEDDITPDIPLGFWNRSEDSTATHCLFITPKIQGLLVDFELVASEPAFTSAGRSATRMRVNAMLTVSIAEGDVALRFASLQDFYFRLGGVYEGEDSTRWYIAEWHELGDSTARPDGLPTTWNELKAWCP